MKKTSITLLLFAIATFCFSINARQFTPITAVNKAGKQVTIAPKERCMVTFYWENCHWCHVVMDKIRDEENDVVDYISEAWPAYVLWKVPNYVVACYDTEDEKSRIIQRFKDNNWETSMLYFVKNYKTLFDYLGNYGISAVPVIMKLDDKSNVTETIVGDKYNLGEILNSIMLDLAAP